MCSETSCCCSVRSAGRQRRPHGGAGARRCCAMPVACAGRRTRSCSRHPRMRCQPSRQLSTRGTHPHSTLLMTPDQATTASSAMLWRLSISETGVTLGEPAAQLLQRSIHSIQLLRPGLALQLQTSKPSHGGYVLIKLTAWSQTRVHGIAASFPQGNEADLRPVVPGDILRTGPLAYWCFIEARPYSQTVQQTGDACTRRW